MDNYQNEGDYWGEIDQGIHGPPGRREELMNDEFQQVLQALMMQGALPEGSTGQMNTTPEGAQEFGFPEGITEEQAKMIMEAWIRRSQ